MFNTLAVGVLVLLGEAKCLEQELGAYAYANYQPIL
jgi:hypothetical protein